VNQHFGGTYRFHLRGRRLSNPTKWHEAGNNSVAMKFDPHVPPKRLLTFTGMNLQSSVLVSVLYLHCESEYTAFLNVFIIIIIEGSTDLCKSCPFSGFSDKLFGGGGGWPANLTPTPNNPVGRVILFAIKFYVMEVPEDLTKLKLEPSIRSLVSSISSSQNRCFRISFFVYF
jgi:hypothetical protein